MFNIGNNAASDSVGVSGIRTPKRASSGNEFVIKNNIIDEGVISFGLWLNSQESKYSADIPIVMKAFTQDRKVVLKDNALDREVVVNILEGVPSCAECKLSDCAHVGFAICIEQMRHRSKIE